MTFISLNSSGSAVPLLINSRHCGAVTELNDSENGRFTLLSLNISPDMIKRVIIDMRASEIEQLLSAVQESPGGTISLSSNVTGQDTIIRTNDISLIRKIRGDLAIIHYQRKLQAVEHYTDHSFETICEMVISADESETNIVDSGFEENHRGLKWLRHFNSGTQ